MDIQTKTYKLFDIYPDIAREYAQKLHKKKEDIEYVQKFYASDKSETLPGERALVSHITTSTLDRDQEVLLPKGMKAERYEKSGKPVFWGHSYSDPNDVVGQCQWLKMDPQADGIIAKTVFRQNEFADEVYQLYTEDLTGQGPILRGFSVGFIPIAWDTGKKDGDPRRTYTEWELLEYSCVSIPCNPDAQTILAQKKLNLCERLKKDLGLEEPDSAVVDEDKSAGDGEVAKAAEHIASTIQKAIDAIPEGGTVVVEAGEHIVAEPIVVPEGVSVEGVEKSLDLKGNPSVSDIYSALYRAIDPEADTRPYDEVPPVVRFAADLYPVNYPDGWVVISEWEANQAVRYWLYKYRYADGVATLAENPVEVAAGYVRKEWAERKSFKGGSVTVDLTLGESLAALKDITDWLRKIEAKLDAPKAADEPATSDEARPCKPEPEGSTPSAGSDIITFRAADPDPLASYVKSGGLREDIRLIIAKQLGRVE